jgi:deazaflavin-dependent oxidoreductase (nitroreductase family)
MRPSFGRFTAWASQLANKRGLYLGRRSTRIHVALYRRSGGRLGGHLPGWPDARIVLLDHTGARSGRRHTSPLMCKDLDGSIVVAGSKGGQPTHPAWYHNLRANPETTIQLGSEVREVRARVATGEERERLWSQLVELFPGYDFYRAHAKGREIPVIVLDPR